MAVETNVQSLTVSESAFQGKDEQLARQVEELGDEVVRTGQECDCKVEGVLI